MVVSALFAAVPELGNVLLITLLFFFTFAVVGVDLLAVRRALSGATRPAAAGQWASLTWWRSCAHQQLHGLAADGLACINPAAARNCLPPPHASS